MACGGESTVPATAACDAETRADTYVANLTKAGAMQNFSLRLIESTPRPPDRGDNTWALQLLDQNLVAVSTGTVTAKPWMPDHGHGTTPQMHRARATGGGQLHLGPMDLFMPGYWTVTFSVEADGKEDTVVFKFCLEG